MLSTDHLALLLSELAADLHLTHNTTQTQMRIMVNYSLKQCHQIIHDCIFQCDQIVDGFAYHVNQVIQRTMVAMTSLSWHNKVEDRPIASTSYWQSKIEERPITSVSWQSKGEDIPNTSVSWQSKGKESPVKSLSWKMKAEERPKYSYYPLIRQTRKRFIYEKKVAHQQTTQNKQEKLEEDEEDEEEEEEEMCEVVLSHKEQENVKSVYLAPKNEILTPRLKIEQETKKEIQPKLKQISKFTQDDKKEGFPGKKMPVQLKDLSELEKGEQANEENQVEKSEEEEKTTIENQKIETKLSEEQLDKVEDVNVQEENEQSEQETETEEEEKEEKHENVEEEKKKVADKAADKALRKSQKRRKNKLKRQAEKRKERERGTFVEIPPHVLAMRREEKECTIRFILLYEFLYRFAAFRVDLEDLTAHLVKIKVDTKDETLTRKIGRLEKRTVRLITKVAKYLDEYKIKSFLFPSFTTLLDIVKEKIVLLQEGKLIFESQFGREKGCDSLISFKVQSDCIYQYVLWIGIFKNYEQHIHMELVEWEPMLKKMWKANQKKNKNLTLFSFLLQHARCTSPQCYIPKCICGLEDCASYLVGPFFSKLFRVKQDWQTDSPESRIRERAVDCEEEERDGSGCILMQKFIKHDD